MERWVWAEFHSGFARDEKLYAEKLSKELYAQLAESGYERGLGFDDFFKWFVLVSNGVMAFKQRHAASRKPMRVKKAKAVYGEWTKTAL